MCKKSAPPIGSSSDLSTQMAPPIGSLREFGDLTWLDILNFFLMVILPNNSSETHQTKGKKKVSRIADIIESFTNDTWLYSLYIFVCLPETPNKSRKNNETCFTWSCCAKHELFARAATLLWGLSQPWRVSTANLLKLFNGWYLVGIWRDDGWCMNCWFHNLFNMKYIDMIS